MRLRDERFLSGKEIFIKLHIISALTCTDSKRIYFDCLDFSENELKFDKLKEINQYPASIKNISFMINYRIKIFVTRASKHSCETL